MAKWLDAEEACTNLYPPGVWLEDAMTPFFGDAFVLCCFVSVFMLSLSHGPSSNRPSIFRRPDSHTRFFFFPFANLEMPLFPGIFCTIAVFSLYVVVVVVVVVVVFTLKAVPVSTQYFRTSVLVQLTRTPSVVTG